ncbi:unnamed protein product [Hymenolepis diminuta]|uniref:PSI domain-containing protein n=1 Tax=Hymenolepis diminuta TaxID=6216 RepID=A0A564YVM2_HYMDI|nr:unnamed protein product [Hymenolepis diminuta]
MLLDNDIVILPCEGSVGCEQCLANTTCMFCQSTSKCLPFPISRLGMVSWSDCPPNLSSLYWYSCRLSYAYVLALAIAIFFFLGLLLLCCCAICVMHRRRNFRNRIISNFSGNPSVGDNAVLTPSQGSLPPYQFHRLLVR